MKKGWRHEQIFSQIAPHSVPTFGLEISWGTDLGYVNVASILNPAAALDPFSIVNDCLREAGLPVVNLDALREHSMTATEWRGFVTPLESVADVNTVLRKLRQARDGAFASELDIAPQNKDLL